MDIVVANIQQLTADKLHHQFSRDHFDLIVVDECHHTAAMSYRQGRGGGMGERERCATFVVGK